MKYGFFHLEIWERISIGGGENETEHLWVGGKPVKYLRKLPTLSFVNNVLNIIFLESPKHWVGRIISNQSIKSTLLILCSKLHLNKCNTLLS